MKEAIKITATGITVTTGAASAATAIPNTASGKTARIVRVICPVPSAYAYIKPGTSTTTATADCIAVTANEQLILDVNGCTHIAHIQGSAAAKINIVPIEW
ncbi:hypothetical protein [Methylobacter sp. sgz302048]|uniref:hypothetical protein n=1 Tax=Methylobacter sp. sgz302048 TaxID=3455945 RepID=UPI003FA16F95